MKYLLLAQINNSEVKNKTLTKHLLRVAIVPPLLCWAHPPLLSPWTKKSEPLSACSNMDTFWRILWQSDRTSSSLQMSFTWKKNEWKIKPEKYYIEISSNFLMEVVGFCLPFCTNSSEVFATILKKNKAKIKLEPQSEKCFYDPNSINYVEGKTVNADRVPGNRQETVTKTFSHTKCVFWIHLIGIIRHRKNMCACRMASNRR